MSRLPFMALRNVSRNRRRSGITMAAIVLGVALILVLRGFVIGAADLMAEDVANGRVGALQIHRAGWFDSVAGDPTKLPMPYDADMVRRIKQVRGVRGVTGRLAFNGLVSNGRAQTLVMGRAVDLEHEDEACPRSAALVKPGGQPLSRGDQSVALIGYELASSLGLVTVAEKAQQVAAGADGAKLQDSFSIQSSSPGGRQNAIDVAVKGFTLSSLPMENKRVLTLPLPVAQDLLGMQGQVTEYAVGIDDLSQVNRVVAELRAELGPDYEVHPWPELQPIVRDMINRFKVILGGISLVLFVIVVAGIVNTMLMSVFERVREIGTMLAVGVRRRQVLGLFVLEAALLGLLGGLAGATLGRSAVALIAWRGVHFHISGTSGDSVLRPSLASTFVALTVVVAMLGAVAAAIYPAYRASKLNPVDALRST